MDINFKEHRQIRTLELVSSSEDPAMWSHPQLDLYSLAELATSRKSEKLPEQRAKLYLVPSSFGEEFEPGFEPVPTSATELPELHAWTMKFAVSVLEIWAGRRQPAQLISKCHRQILSMSRIFVHIKRKEPRFLEALPCTATAIPVISTNRSNRTN